MLTGRLVFRLSHTLRLLLGVSGLLSSALGLVALDGRRHGGIISHIGKLG